MLDKYINTKQFKCVFSAFLFAYAVWLILGGWDGYKYTIIQVNDHLYAGIKMLVLLTSFMLVASSRITDAMMPAMTIVVISTACYDSADKFLSPSFLWVAPIAVFAVIFHFIKYRKAFKIGRSFWGLCAVSLAVTLGGVGSISASDYFGGSSLFYVFGLGIGMILFYLLVKSQIEDDEKQDVARIMYFVGMLAAFSILWVYVTNWDEFVKTGRLLAPQFGNNLSTLMMMAMPFPFLYSSKRYVDFLAVGIMHVALVFSGSRAGLILGTLEFICLFIVYSVFYQKGIGGIVRRILFIGFLFGYFAAAWYFLPEIVEMCGYKTLDLSRIEILEKILGSTVESGEARLKLIDRMVADFKSNPIFGVGIGYTGNSDIYSPVKGAMNWYHMWIPQIVGSLGIVGILAYGYQLVSRVCIFFKSREFSNFVLATSYAGLLLMSQVNPGEFCPVPYAMLAVTFFAFIENRESDMLLSDAVKKGIDGIKNIKSRVFGGKSKSA